MRPRRLPEPPQRLDLHRRPIADGEVYVAYHIVTTDELGSEDLLTSFKSRRATGLPPREWTQEGTNPEIAEGISAYQTREAANATALKTLARGRAIGEYVAELHLRAGQGVEIAEWGPNGHLTIWGDPLMLSSQVVDIVPVT